MITVIAFIEVRQWRVGEIERRERRGGRGRRERRDGGGRGVDVRMFLCSHFYCDKEMNE